MGDYGYFLQLHITLNKGRPYGDKRVLKFCKQSNLVIKKTNANLIWCFPSEFSLATDSVNSTTDFCNHYFSRITFMLYCVFFVGVKCWEREMIHVQLKVVSDFNQDVHMRKLDRDGRN